MFQHHLSATIPGIQELKKSLDGNTGYNVAYSLLPPPHKVVNLG